MPNRIIHETCRTSPNLARLSADAERLFWRLTTLADDHGRFEADADMVRCSCFPKILSHYPTMKVQRLLNELVRGGLLSIYGVKDRQYGQFCSWARYQRVRADRSKYPGVEESTFIQAQPPQPPSSADNGTHSRANAPVNENENENENERHPRANAPVNENENENENERHPRANAPAEEFDRFWSMYPRKVGKDDARKAWQRLKPDGALVSRVLSALSAHRQSRQWQEDGGKFIPHPSTWLNKRRWNDVLDSELHESERKKREILDAGTDR
jgi:hypothetical protein